MKYENKENALSLIKEIEKNEERLKCSNEVVEKPSDYTASILITYRNIVNTIEITLTDEQVCHILKRVAQDAKRDIDKYKSELEKL